MGEESSKAIEPLPMPTYCTIKKSYYYTFFPTKAKEEEEEAARAQSCSGLIRLGRSLVEIRDVHPWAGPNRWGPWTLVKKMMEMEVRSGRFYLSHRSMFEHVFRHWPMACAEKVAVSRQSMPVVVCDATDDEINPKMYQGSDDVYVAITAEGHYFLSCRKMMRDRNLKYGDCVGLFWDDACNSFKFRLFCRSNNMHVV